jgi:hypothetical protein
VVSIVKHFWATQIFQAVNEQQPPHFRCHLGNARARYCTGRGSSTIKPAVKELVRISRSTTAILTPLGWAATNDLPSYKPHEQRVGWTPGNTATVPLLPPCESTTNDREESMEMEDFQQRQEEDCDDLGEVADAGAPGEYFDYVP